MNSSRLLSLRGRGNAPRPQRFLGTMLLIKIAAPNEIAKRAYTVFQSLRMEPVEAIFLVILINYFNFIKRLLHFLHLLPFNYIPISPEICRYP